MTVGDAAKYCQIFITFLVISHGNEPVSQNYLIIKEVFVELPLYKKISMRNFFSKYEQIPGKL